MHKYTPKDIIAHLRQFELNENKNFNYIPT